MFPVKGQLNKDRFIDGLKAKLFFMAFYYYGWFGVGKICIENPLPSGVYELPKHSQVIQPFEFGHPYTKRTQLWLFGLPPLIPTDIILNPKPYVPSGTGRKLRGDSYGGAKRGNDSKNRSKTFPGIAKAMAQQWG